MSYIHEALKKAQVERDLGKDSRGNPPVPRRKKAFFTTRKGLFPTVLGVLVLLAFAGYSWWDQRNEKPDTAPRTGPPNVRASTSAGKDRVVPQNRRVDRQRDRPASRAPRQTAVKMPPATPTRPQAGPEEDAVAGYEKARALHREGRLSDAARGYEKVISMDPGHVAALNNRGVLYLRQKNYAEARKCFEKATRLRPGYVDPYYNLACVSAAEGRLRLGLRYLEKAVSMDPHVRDWAQKDPDLDPLRGLPRFRETVVNE